MPNDFAADLFDTANRHRTQTRGDRFQFAPDVLALRVNRAARRASVPFQRHRPVFHRHFVKQTPTHFFVLAAEDKEVVHLILDLPQHLFSRSRIWSRITCQLPWKRLTISAACFDAFTFEPFVPENRQATFNKVPVQLIHHVAVDVVEFRHPIKYFRFCTD